MFAQERGGDLKEEERSELGNDESRRSGRARSAVSNKFSSRYLFARSRGTRRASVSCMGVGVGVGVGVDEKEAGMIGLSG